MCFKLTGKLVDAQQTVHILKTLGRFTKGMDRWNGQGSLPIFVKHCHFYSIWRKKQTPEALKLEDALKDTGETGDTGDTAQGAPGEQG